MMVMVMMIVIGEFMCVERKGEKEREEGREEEREEEKKEREERV